MKFDSIPSAIKEIKKGGMVVVLDNEDRENDNMTAAFVKASSPPKVVFLPDEFEQLRNVNRINALYINYTVLEKIDPNFKG